MVAFLSFLSWRISWTRSSMAGFLVFCVAKDQPTARIFLRCAADGASRILLITVYGPMHVRDNGKSPGILRRVFARISRTTLSLTTFSLTNPERKQGDASELANGMAFLRGILR